MNKTDQTTPSSDVAYEIVSVRFSDLPNTYSYNRNQLNLKIVGCA